MSNEVIGFMAVDSTRDDHVIAGMTGEVVALYVLSAYWRTGIGRALWVAGLQSLVERGYRQAMLWVLSENARARHFYAKAVWSPEPGSERSRLIGGASLREIRYRSPVLR
ncbi:N-acetyltransferase [Pseudomonas sp. PA15(2017)]|uniref:GNAT family N-acetyltransferase n=1 Tax=Pseudomonas sp. PA15(2017) TaxID=1932111 RepID=UPI0009F93914|nr:GNAT family N-acetyltransferase [Pseudomonas sp. PA15(2017)]